MCGIIGITASSGDVTARALEALKRLEYRGYDSAGIAVQLEDGTMVRARAKGKIAALEEKLRAAPLPPARMALGHTRWATHGKPSEANAHPHGGGKVTLVHNGVIENYAELRAELRSRGYVFESETDTETAAALLEHFLSSGLSPRAAMLALGERLRGSYALAVMFARDPGVIWAARRGSPLAVGFAHDGCSVASDAYALAPLAETLCYLEDGDVAAVSRTGAEIVDREGSPVFREVRRSVLSASPEEKNGYPHYMLKEIFEQPAAVAETLRRRHEAPERGASVVDLARSGTVKRVELVACGTSYYAAMTACHWFERLARTPARADVASEYRYQGDLLPESGTAALFVSQSGETADTLAAMRHAKRCGRLAVALVNAPETSMEREAQYVLRTHAGPEIGVASTKAFTAQLAALAGAALDVAKARAADPTLPPGSPLRPDEAELERFERALGEIPALMAEALACEDQMKSLAAVLAESRHVFYMGRGVSYPLALEGALKLKEISYIRAEGFAAGEMKHGPIALIEEGSPVVAPVPYDAWFEKTVSNLQEAAARGARVIALTDARGAEELRRSVECVAALPSPGHRLLSPLILAVPVQLLAYHTAALKGADIDQPRNLAKSVTVE